MAVTVELPVEALRRIEAEAARREVGIEIVIAELAATLPVDSTGEAPVRRRFALAGIGESDGPRFARDADDLLAEGFGSG